MDFFDLGYTAAYSSSEVYLFALKDLGPLEQLSY